jgi:hypothetical protein
MVEQRNEILDDEVLILPGNAPCDSEFLISCEPCMNPIKRKQLFV